MGLTSEYYHLFSWYSTIVKRFYDYKKECPNENGAPVSWGFWAIQDFYGNNKRLGMY